MREPPRSTQSGTAPAPAFLAGLISPLTGAHSAPAMPACWSCPECAGHRDPCRWPLPRRRLLPPDMCRARSLNSFKSGLSVKPTLATPLNCSPPAPNPTIPTPFAFVQNVYDLPTQIHLPIIFTVYHLPPPARV